MAKKMAGLEEADSVTHEGWPLVPSGYDVIMEIGQVRCLYVAFTSQSWEGYGTS